jgi:L,D-peptidoglycan transpeptidase YkuD (ErfK/YbiS/YcfS/YnhG family)
MKMGDPAHRLKIVIEHNTGPDVVQGAGSAIFFHIWRKSGTRPTSGCTAMDAAHLEDVLRWLKQDAGAVYVLTDTKGAQAARAAGGLP